METVRLPFSRLSRVDRAPFGEELPRLVFCDLRAHAHTADGARELAELVDAPLNSSCEEVVGRVLESIQSGRIRWEHTGRLGWDFVVESVVDDESTPLTELAEPVDLVPDYAIVIELIGEDDGPVPGVKYELAFPDGSVRTGTLDSDGRAQFNSLADPGECKVCFPTLDKDAWQYIHATPI